MQLLLTLLITLLVGAAVVVVPGACIVALTRLDRIVPPPLVPAAAVALGLLPVGLLTAGTLAVHLPIEAGVIGLVAFVALSWSSLATRERRAAKGSRARVRLRGWHVGPRQLVAGEWVRGIPRSALAVAAVGSVIALLTGFYAWNDSLYHIAQAAKLMSLEEPSFTNTVQFRDGSAHPGYLLPVWQEVIALTALLARVEPTTAAWILPGVTFPIGLLAMGGLAWTLTRSRAATTVGAAAWLVVTIATLPYADSIINSMHPGVVALSILAPLVLSMLFTSLWTPTGRDDGGVHPSTSARAARVLAGVAVLGLGTLHVSYLWVLGMGILGYYLVWALRAPWPAAVVKRHLATGATIALVAAACIVVLLPGLQQLEGLGRDAKEELEHNDSEQYQGENAANLDALLRGDPEGDFHLRADYLVLAGGLALAGLLVVPLALLAPRWPAGWYLLGSTVLVLAIALSDQLFPGFVRVVTLDQARRIERVLPTTIGLAMGALAIGIATEQLWRRATQRMRIAAAAVALLGTGLVATLAGTISPLGGYAGEQIVEPRVLVALLVLLVVGLGAWIALLVVRLTRRGHRIMPALRQPLLKWTWPGELVGPIAATVAVLVVLVGAIPVYGAVGDVVDERRLEEVPPEMRGAELRLFDATVAKELRKLTPGSVVLADPRTRNPYVAMAIAPVYVVSSVPRHTALTPANRVDSRFATAVSFFDGDLRAGLALRERIQILRTEEVDAILVHPQASTPIRKELGDMSGVDLVATGKNQQLFLLDRERLPAAPKR